MKRPANQTITRLHGRLNKLSMCAMICSLNDIFIATLTLWYKEILYDRPPDDTLSLWPVSFLSLCVNALSFTSMFNSLSVLLSGKEGSKRISKRLFIFLTLSAAYLLRILAKYVFIEAERYWVLHNISTPFRSTLADFLNQSPSLRYIEIII